MIQVCHLPRSIQEYQTTKINESFTIKKKSVRNFPVSKYNIIDILHLYEFIVIVYK